MSDTWVTNCGEQITVTGWCGWGALEPIDLALTWLCRPSGIRADGVGASGSQGWLPAL